ncbi:hypothetical protein [Deinococcus puniceus]|uniref:Uncharacterized protein n=1 Tax=Deinococcus puniceus TaxID=1182568 RepID=A0A172T8Q4_9DEIO|nr:hypothetical protein [Deinococcus puniceus]ANE43332.1 hypothetical protein SU48_05635 [Deinococcus puniceus]
MNLQDVVTAFESAYTPDPREGLSVTHEVMEGKLQIEVRHQDQDALRGFDVVAEPLETEHRSAADLGRDMAEVVARELAYGQLSAVDEEGKFKRIVV